MNKLYIYQMTVFLAAVIIAITFAQSSLAQSNQENKQINACIEQGFKHAKNKYNISRVIKSFDSHISPAKKYDGILISAQKGLTYVLLVCGNPSLKDFKMGIFDMNKKGITGAKSQALKGVWVSILKWVPERDGIYLVIVFAMGGNGDISLLMMAKG